MNEAPKNWLLFAFALCLTLLYLFPIYWMYVTGLKSATAMFAYPPRFIPTDANWDVYRQVWARTNMGTAFWNSLVIGTGTTVLTAIIGTGAAYVLARYRSRWIDVSLFIILMLQVLPPSLMITPTYVGFFQLGLLDMPRLAVVLATTAKQVPFFIVLVRAAFIGVPRELEEAALVDGNSRVGAFYFIVLPLARNGILVCSIIVFMHGFGEFVYSKSIIQAPEYQPMSLGLYSFMGPNTTEWNTIMAFASIYATPILAAFVMMQRRIVSGLTSGAIK